MLWLLLSIEGERYAIESGDVVEILPWVKLQTLHQAPATIAGLLNDRDRPIPIVDLSQLLYGRACRLHVCTRIILVTRSHSNPTHPKTEIIGLLAEQVAQTRQILDGDRTQITPPVVKTPFVSTILSEPQGVTQCLDMRAIGAAVQPVLLDAVMM